jgi:hypothetical protein
MLKHHVDRYLVAVTVAEQLHRLLSPGELACHLADREVLKQRADSVRRGMATSFAIDSATARVVNRAATAVSRRRISAGRPISDTCWTSRLTRSVTLESKKRARRRPGSGRTACGYPPRSARST